MSREGDVNTDPNDGIELRRAPRPQRPPGAVG